MHIHKHKYMYKRKQISSVTEFFLKKKKGLRTNLTLLVLKRDGKGQIIAEN